MTTRTRCGWGKSKECGQLLHSRRFSIKLEGAVYRSYERPAMLCGSEVWCQE